MGRRRREALCEILTFDPRGVGQTTPAASCFAEGWQKKLWELQKQGAGVIDSSDEAFAVHYQYERAHGELCDQAGPGSIHAHLGTASVARDLLHIVDKVDEKHRRDNSPGPLRRPEAGKPNLQYFGHSYGSVLGNYFASMFPGRVGRMLVSAIVDADDYRVGVSRASPSPIPSRMLQESFVS